MSSVVAVTTVVPVENGAVGSLEGERPSEQSRPWGFVPMPGQLYDHLAQELRTHFKGTLEPWEFVEALDDEIFFVDMP